MGDARGGGTYCGLVRSSACARCSVSHNMPPTSLKCRASTEAFHGKIENIPQHPRIDAIWNFQNTLCILWSQVEKLILARRQLFENERKREMSIYAELAEAEEKRLVIIEEERKRLLTESSATLEFSAFGSGVGRCRVFRSGMVLFNSVV